MSRDRDSYEVLLHEVIGAFYEVHRQLGNGLLESLYARALELELLERGHHVEREVWVTVYYKGRELGRQRLDMVVNGVLVVDDQGHSGPAQTRHVPGLQLHTSNQSGVGAASALRPRASVLSHSDATLTEADGRYCGFAVFS